MFERLSTIPIAATTLLGDAGFWHKAWFRDSASTALGVETDEIAMALWWICVGWFVFLMGLMFYFVFKYRRRAPGPAARSIAHNTPLEVAWTVIPTLFLIWMFFAGYKGYINKFIAPGNALEVRVTGVKWSWSVAYPGGAETNETTKIGAKEIPVFYFPASTPVRMIISSIDVIHAVYVPDFRIKVDAMPNRYTTVWFEAKSPETAPNARRFGPTEPEWKRNQPYTDHNLYCAEYCGDEHSEMWAVVRIVPDAVYKAWIVDMKEGGGKAPEEVGKQAWKTRCSSCHTVDGSKGTGPTWKDLFGHTVEIEGGPSVVADENYIRESIRTPAVKIVKGYPNQMTPWGPDILSEKQIDNIIAYMKSISIHAPKDPTAAPGDKPADAHSPPAEKK